jgi:DNA-binding winged helix-turn-helix (wHTH) protein
MIGLGAERAGPGAANGGPRRIRVADAEVDLLSGEVSRGGTTVRVAPKTAQVLAALCRRAGEIVSKEALIEEVWSDAFVTDDGLWHGIAELRRVFDDDARSPGVIETLPRRGYRLLAHVEPSAPPAAGEAPVSPAAAGERETVPRHTWLVGLPLVLAVALGGGIRWGSSRAARSHSLDKLLEEARSELEGTTSGH